MPFSINSNILIQTQPGNLSAVRQQIQQNLGGISCKVNVSISPTASASLRDLSDSMGAAAGSANKLTAELAAQNTAFNQTITHANQTSSSFNSFAASTNKATAATSAYSQAMGNANAQVAALGGNASKLTNFAVGAAAVATFASATRQGVQSAFEYEKQLVKLQQGAGTTKEELRLVQAEVATLSKGLGVASQELLGAGVAMRRAGVSAEDARLSLKALAEASLSPSFGDMARTTEGAIAIFKNFGVQARDLGTSLSALDSISANFGVGSADMLDGVKRVGATFRAAGGDLNEFAALLATVKQNSSESGESIGAAIAKITTRLQQVATQNSLKQIGVDLRYTAKEAEALGSVGGKNLKDQFVGPYEAIRRVSAAMKDLQSTDPRFTAVAEQLGGFRQLGKVIPLLQDMETTQKALNVAQAGGTQLTMDAATSQDTYLNKLSRKSERNSAS